MCDEHLGRVLAAMDEHDLWKDTMLIVCTDHGFLLAEHDWWGKNRMPLWNEIAHVPLFVWDPRSAKAGERRRSIAQLIDFAPTLLRYFGCEPTADMTGRDLATVIERDEGGRGHAIWGIFGGQVNITDGRWVYMRGPVRADNAPLHEHTLMPTHLLHTFDVSELQDIRLAEPFSFTKGCRTMKVAARNVHRSVQHEYGTLLYDIEKDYAQEHPVEDQEIERRMAEALAREIKLADAPPEQYERLGLARP
jgi:arylsulfatase A-like enzyme